jgi:hypothetical protein
VTAGAAIAAVYGAAMGANAGPAIVAATKAAEIVADGTGTRATVVVSGSISVPVMAITMALTTTAASGSVAAQ